MKRNKIVSILEYSARNKMLVGILAVSLIGAGGVFLSSNATISNNTIGINKTVLAGTLNNNGNKACVINGNDSLVLYTSASNSSIQSYISVGEMLTINSYSNGYYNVTVQETGATGYISSSNMQKIVSGVGYDLTSLSGIAYTTNVSTAVNLREEATMNSEALAKLKNNTSVELLGKQGDWYKVSDNGTTGYIYGEYIAIANTNSNTSSNSSSSSSATTSSSSSKTVGTTSSNSGSSTKATSSKSSTSTTGTTSNIGSSSSSSSSTTGTTTKSTSSNNNSSSSNSTAQIKWVLGNGEFSNPNTVVIENTTGKAISNSTLVTYMRDWISNAQPNYYKVIASDTWAPEFLNVVPNSELVQAFISANGKNALNENITANELYNANIKLIESVNKNPILSQTQIYNYIYKNILPKKDIVKIVYSNNSYEIFSMNNGKEILYAWIEAGTGFQQ